MLTGEKKNTERLWDKKVQRDDEMYDSDEEIEENSRKMADVTFGATGTLAGVSLAPSNSSAGRPNKEQASSEITTAPSGGVSTKDSSSLTGRVPAGGTGAPGGVTAEVRTNSRTTSSSRTLDNPNLNNVSSMEGVVDEHVNTGQRRSGEVVSTAASGGIGQQNLATGINKNNNGTTGAPAAPNYSSGMDGDGDVDMGN